MRYLARAAAAALILGLVSVAVVRAGDPPTGEVPKAVPGFDKLKALHGEWQAKLEGGKTVDVIYEVTAAGSAVLETLKPGTAPMLTVYHADGETLMLTHYCSSGNQPRMRATSVSPEKIEFSFLDATNLAKPTDGHMHKLVVKLTDENHFTQEWTWSQDGKEKTLAFAFERKK